MKQSKRFRAVIAFAVAVMMFVGMLPMSALAAPATMPDHITVLQDVESNLAPGVTQNVVTALDKNGDRVEMFIASVDMSEETVMIQANYKDNDPSSWGMQLTTEQAAAAEANHDDPYNVVVAINASYYNTDSGQPTGAFAMEGNLINSDAAGNGYAFFAILKDGTAMIGAKGEYSAYKDQIVEAIGGYHHIVKDGAVVSGLNDVDKYPRQTIGVTADGNVIIMTADGNRQPKTIGLTIKEQAEVMLSLGCVEAVHLDGGGSATYCSKPEGSDKLQVTNNPSNGSERAVSNTLIVVSKAVADGTFDHANLMAENEYITPGNSTVINTIGVDAAGGAAEIPEDISWALADASFGTVADGVFTSSGKTGDAVVQMIYGGKVVGEATVHVVVPMALSFSRNPIVVPFDKTVDLGISATYGAYDVAYTAADLDITVTAGAMNGLDFTAPAESAGITSGTATVTLKANEAITATTGLTFGKGSEVIFDFEAGSVGTDLDNWILRTHESKLDWNEQGELSIVNAETGLVYSGDQALAFHADFSQTVGSGSNTASYVALSLSWGGDPISVKGAKRIGFWLYIPEDAMSTEITMNTVYYNANGTPARRTIDANDDNGIYIYTPYWGDNMEKSGWHYVSIDTSNLSDDLYIHDEPTLDSAYKRNFFIKIFCVFGQDSNSIASDYHGDFTYYIDDITVDYSEAVDDRQLPVFENSSACYDNEQIIMKYGQTATIGNNSFFVTTNVFDNTYVGLSADEIAVNNALNATGIDAASAKIYVDGNEVDATYSNGILSSANFTVPNGEHVIVFEIADKAGNVKQIERKVTVNGTADLPTVSIVPQDATLDRLLSGSVYWVDVVSEDIADIEKVEMLLNINSINKAEVEQIVANGFDVTVSQTAAQAAEQDVMLTFTRNGEAIDGNVIASIPVRIWESLVHTYPTLESKTPQAMWTSGAFDPRELRVNIDKGLVTYVDDTTSFFSGSIVRDHEAYTAYYAMDKTYHAQKGSYHVHTAEALADVAATCTEDGYTGRTYCAVCDSVVDWGTAVKAAGHTYAFADGVLKCACGELFNGVYTDGLTYVNGVVIADGWNADHTKYFVDGLAITGTHIMDNAVCIFGADGTYDKTASETYLGFVEYEGDLYFAQLGKLVSGWFADENENYYYMQPDVFKAVEEGFATVNGKTYEFADKILIDGHWEYRGDGPYYSPAGVYLDWAGNQVSNGWKTIKGNTYYFWNGYAYTGFQAIDESWSSGIDQWHLFDEVTGVHIRKLEGVYKDKFYIDGVVCSVYYGMVKDANGDIYFVDEGAKILKNRRIYVSEQFLNDMTYADGTKLAVGYYEFDENGKLKVNEGVVDDYFYVNNKRLPAYYGMVKDVNGDIYFVDEGAKILKNIRIYVSAQFLNGMTYADGTAIPVGYYEFDKDGKLLINEGVVGDYFYVNNVRLRAYYGMVKDAAGDYYFVDEGGKILRSIRVRLTDNFLNGLTYPNGEQMTVGYYTFAADGKLILD